MDSGKLRDSGGESISNVVSDLTITIRLYLFEMSWEQGLWNEICPYLPDKQSLGTSFAVLNGCYLYFRLSSVPGEWLPSYRCAASDATATQIW